MDPMIIRYGLMAAAAAISGFFLLGFVPYTIYALINWQHKKSEKEKIWGGLTGVCLNGLVFVFTFPKILPIIIEAIEKVLVRFL